MRKLIAMMALLACMTLGAAAQQVPQSAVRYQKPPQAVLDVLDAPAPMNLSVNPTRDYGVLYEPVRYPPIAELAQPMLRLAGVRINPATNGPHNPPRIKNLMLKRLSDGRETKLVTPAGAKLSAPLWSPNGKHFALTNTMATGIALLVGDVATGTVRVIPGVKLNAAIASPFAPGFAWMPDSRTLLCRLAPAGRGKPPVEPTVPVGPNVQENFGRAAPSPTFQDLLQNPYDEDLFDYYAIAQLALVDSVAGTATPLGKPAVITQASPAPDGQHILVTRLKRPYSYLRTLGSFPSEVEVWDRTGKMVRHIVSNPLAENIPLGGVQTGPRNINWMSIEPATLVWAEALDDGNPRKKVPQRDKVMTLRIGKQAEPTELLRTEHRYSGIAWGESGTLALLREFERERNWVRTWFFNPKEPGAKPRLVWEMSSSERYKDPGNPMSRPLPSGHAAMLQSGDFIFLDGAGATPEGDRPFLDKFNIKTLQAERLWRCDDKSYESVMTWLTPDGTKFLTRHESPGEPPNYFVRTAGGDARALTKFADPTPQLRAIKKELVKYKRADGVDLSFTMYLPPDYKAGERRPAVVWAYPLEFTGADVAGQVSGSDKRFTMITGMSHLFFLLQGYVVLDSATMPVVGDPQTVNDTYVEQIVSSAQAAIDKGAEMGVIDPNRVGVGGHSYGAFMTANLMAHSHIFRAGIARSGAYNRTLTPFGFQSERRTIWEAPETYIKMSPFMNAQKIKEPILLIHGEADNNSGTFPIQSERMYAALKGNGGNVRYVTLPHEAHGYAARESLEHTLWEMINWFDKYVKNAGPREQRAGAGE
ncbi:MAG: prolyl oligopeptidase family serine peptidase [Acidobacteria bacterium]|nr:prolyl oligopeptidase family serine peptidase [Acidobacteriota bacterium]